MKLNSANHRLLKGSQSIKSLPEAQIQQHIDVLRGQEDFLIIQKIGKKIRHLKYYSQKLIKMCKLIQSKILISFVVKNKAIIVVDVFKKPLQMQFFHSLQIQVD